MSVHLAGRLATRDTALGDRCPIDRTMRAIGNRSAMLLLREAFYGVTRFDDLAARVGVTDAVADLLPVVFALGRWGARHIPGGGPALTHEGCGEPVEVVARCAAGHVVPEDELRVSGRA